MADENVDVPIIDFLKQNQYQVDIITELGIDDVDVLQQSINLNAILITQDKDFGELVYRNHLDHIGIILVRLEGLSPSKKAKRVFDVIEKHKAELHNSFTVIQDIFLRIRTK